MKEVLVPLVAETYAGSLTHVINQKEPFTLQSEIAELISLSAG